MADKSKDDAAKEGGSKKKIIIIVLIALLLLGGAGGTAAWFFLFKKKPPPPEEQTPEQVKMLQETADKEAEEIGPMVDIKEFIVNIISEDANHYVKASLSLEVNDEKTLEEVNKRMPQIRDAILLLVSNKTIEELGDLEGKKQLKAELKSKINAFLKTGRVKNIFFTDFVVQ